MRYSAQRQSGSVIVYSIVGVLLAALAVGAIIVAQNRGGQQIALQPSTQAPQNEGAAGSDQSSSDDKSAEEKQKEQADKEAADKAAADKKAADEKAKQEAEAKKKADEKAAADKRAAEAKAAQQQTTANTTGPMAQTGGSQSASHLPTTGPVEDTLSMVIGLVAIVGAGYFYYHYGRRA